MLRSAISGGKVPGEPILQHTRSNRCDAVGRIEIRRRELESRRTANPGATVQPTSVQAPRLRACCQWPGGNDGLRTLARLRGRAEADASRRRPRGGAIAELERRARVPVPDLGGVDAVPARDLARGEQEIDRGGGGAAAVARARSRKVSRKWPPSGCGVSPSSAITSSALSSLMRPSASGLVLALADLGEHLPVRRDRHAEPARGSPRRAGAGTGWSRARGRAASAASACPRRAAARPPWRAAASASVLGLDGQPELGVGGRVLVPAVDLGVARQAA